MTCFLFTAAISATTSIRCSNKRTSSLSIWLIFARCCSKEVVGASSSVNSLIIRAGLRDHSFLGNDLVTAPAYTTTLSPNVTPGRTIAPPPIQTLLPMIIRFPDSIPLLRLALVMDARLYKVAHWVQTYSYRQFRLDKHLKTLLKLA